MTPRPLHPSLVPQEIVEWHRALLSALRVDYFAPGLLEMNHWNAFLYVLKSLDETPGGPLTPKDVSAVVTLMRKQNQTGSNWSLRFARIMGDPETFRDLVLQTRRVDRPREPVETRSRTDATGAAIAVESDPAADRDPVAIAEHLSEWKRKMKGQ
jgi:hypothetical protein